MDNMEFNKIFAAILVAGIVAMLSGFVAGKLYHPKDLEENAVKIEGVAVAESGPKVEPKAEPILHLIATADLERGQKLSRACAACHSFDKGGPHGIGPNIWDIVNKQKAAEGGYAYSKVLEERADQKWDYVSLNQFFWKPKKYMPGTKMNYIGLRKPEDRAAIIAWLRTKADTVQPLPSESDIAAEIELLVPPVEEIIEEAVEGASVDEAVEESGLADQADL